MRRGGRLASATDRPVGGAMRLSRCLRPGHDDHELQSGRQLRPAIPPSAGERQSVPTAVPRPLRWRREVAYAAFFYGVYSFTRDTQGSAAVSAAHALHNAVRVIHLERSAHLFVEASLQRSVLAIPAPARLPTSSTSPPTSWSLSSCWCGCTGASPSAFVLRGRCLPSSPGGPLSLGTAVSRRPAPAHQNGLRLLAGGGSRPGRARHDRSRRPRAHRLAGCRGVRRGVDATVVPGRPAGGEDRSRAP